MKRCKQLRRFSLLQSIHRGQEAKAVSVRRAFYQREDAQPVAPVDEGVKAVTLNVHVT